MISRQQLKSIYQDLEAYKSNNKTSKNINKLKDEQILDKIQYIVSFVFQKLIQSFKNLNLIELPKFKISYLIEKIIQFYIKKNNTISIKVIFFITKKVFINFFSKNLATLFLKKDAISIYM